MRKKNEAKDKTDAHEGNQPLSSFGIEMRKRFAKKQSNVVHFLGLELKNEPSQSILS